MPDGSLAMAIDRGVPPVPGVTWHARERAEQHYGPVSPSEWCGIVLDLIERRTMLLRMEARFTRTETHMVRVARPSGDLLLLVVYKPEHAAIITTLPPEARYQMVKAKYGAPDTSPRRRLTEWIKPRGFGRRHEARRNRWSFEEDDR